MVLSTTWKVAAISNIIFSSQDILKYQKITGFYMYTDILRSAKNFLG